jgi:hypothetical protein
MADERFAGPNFTVSLLTLIIAAAVSAAGFVKFEAFDRVLSRFDESIKESDSRTKVVEAENAESANLGVTPLLGFGDRLPGGYLQPMSFRLNLKNLGTSPVELGLITLKVYQAFPSKELEDELVIEARRKERFFSQPAVPSDSMFPPSAEAPAAPRIVEDAKPNKVAAPADVERSEEEELDELSRKPPLNTTMFSVDATKTRWGEVEPHRRKMKVKHTLLSGQETFLQFDYMLVNSNKPQWFKIVATLDPPAKAEGPRHWEQRQVEAVIDAGPWPDRSSISALNMVLSNSNSRSAASGTSPSGAAGNHQGEAALPSGPGTVPISSDDIEELDD